MVGALQYSPTGNRAYARPQSLKMRALRLMLGVLAIGLMTANAGAQESAQTNAMPSFSGASKPVQLSSAAPKLGFSLLDPSRIKFHNSYSMSYFSGGGQASSVGLYMSTLEYQFSQPLSIRVGLGYLHQPLGFLGTSGPEGGEFLPNVRLDWRPSDNMHFSIDYRTVPASLYNTGYGLGYYSPYRRSMNPIWDW